MKTSTQGIANLLGSENLQKLQQSNVCVIGIGGVGSWAIEALVRSGVQKVTLIDMDEICISNINRQIHSLHNTLGQLKTQVMQQRIEQIEPNCKVTIIDDFLTIENIANYIQNFDCVIDAIDDAKVKAALIDYCFKYKIPLVVAGSAGGKSDPTRIEIDDLANTSYDPLLAKIRADLRKNYGFSKNRKFKIPCVFSTEPIKKSLSTEFNKCNAFGSISTITATFGMFCANLAIEILLKDETKY